MLYFNGDIEGQISVKQVGQTSDISYLVIHSYCVVNRLKWMFMDSLWRKLKNAENGLTINNDSILENKKL